jgi:hypothetical protein
MPSEDRSEAVTIQWPGPGPGGGPPGGLIFFLGRNRCADFFVAGFFLAFVPELLFFAMPVWFL